MEQDSFTDDAWPLWDLIGVLTLPGIVRLKAVAGERLAGFAAGDLRGGDGTGWITTLGVHSGFRRQGIARALLEECEKQMDVLKIHLCVRKSNQAAIKLYLLEGYHQIDVWKGYYPDREDALVLEKLIEKSVDSGINKR